jgi:hypothetical protein
MVFVAGSVLLLFGQGVQKVATLVRENAGRIDDHLLCGIEVRWLNSYKSLLKLA